MSLPFRILAATPFALFALFAACHEHDDETPIAGLTDVVYEGGATDEALADLLAAGAKPGDKRARISAPAAGSKLEGAPTFEWSFAATGALTPAHPRPAREHGREPSERRVTIGFSTAFAHGTPMTGTGHLLVVSSASDPKLLRVFTTQTAYKPDAATWDRVKKAGGTLRAVVTSALFEKNKIVAGGGPFEGEAVNFEIAP